MKMSYENLELAAMDGTRIGKWKGNPVYSCAREDYWKYESENSYYIIYNENNLLVFQGFVFGRVKLNGDVEERRVLPYYFPVPKKAEPLDKEVVKTPPEVEEEIEKLSLVDIKEAMEERYGLPKGGSYEDLFNEVMGKDPLAEMKELYGLE